MAKPHVVLRKNLARAIREGHPWVYRDALEPSAPLPDGAILELKTRDGQKLATGFWDSKSTIAFRVLERGPLADVAATIQSRLAAALKRRTDRLDAALTNTFRWVHGEGDLLPGIHVDLYDDVAVVRFDGEGAKAFYGDIAARLSKVRHLRSVVDRLGDRVLAGEMPSGLVVRENQILFEVSLAGGKGGLFLDQRENREVVGGRVAGKTVLNLFGFTGGFALYAARGSAASTTTVDSAKPAIESAKRNFALNGLKGGNFHAEDVFEFLESAAKKGRTWDLVISDPPSFARSKSAMGAATGAYGRLHKLAAQVTAKGGTLCAASCSSHFQRKEFLANVSSAARLGGRVFRLEEVRGAGLDHPVLKAFPEGDYLKFAIGRV